MPSPSLNFLVLRASCWNCGKTLLGLRQNCPHCGKNIPRERKRIAWLYLLFLLIVVAAFAYSSFGHPF